jgi:hypothetical protein
VVDHTGWWYVRFCMFLSELVIVLFLVWRLVCCLWGKLETYNAYKNWQLLEKQVVRRCKNKVNVELYGNRYMEI